MDRAAVADEEAVIEHVQRWAEKHGFERMADGARNIVIRVRATGGESPHRRSCCRPPRHGLRAQPGLAE